MSNKRSSQTNPSLKMLGKKRAGQNAIPDAKEDFQGWLEATDRITSLRFDPSRPLEFDIHRDKPDSFFKEMLNDDVLQEVIGNRRMACAVQLNTSRMAVHLLVEKGFESSWKARGEQGRYVHLKKAYQDLDEDDSSMGIIQVGRMNCPELNYDAVTRDSGQGFIDLVKVFMMENNEAVPTTPFILENERFNEIIGWKPNDPDKHRKVILDMRRLMRTQFISGFVSRVFISCEDKEMKKVVFTNEHRKTHESLMKVKPVAELVFGEAGAIKWQKEQAQRRKEMSLFCSTCLKLENKTVDGKMSVCAKCMTVGREVRYCSRECQKSAWKTHKLECGKPLDISQALSDIVPFSHLQRLDVRPDIPPVLPGYKRSPHLIKLISCLNEFPTKDYCISIPLSGPQIGEEFNGITLGTAQAAATFIVMRNRVMMGMSSEQGVEGALLYVYRVLQKNEGGLPGGTATLRGQLAKEYGEVWDRVWKAEQAGSPYGDPKKVTREEIDQALGYLKTVGRFKNELKNYVPGKTQTPSVTVGIKVGPTKDVLALVDFPKLLMDEALKDPTSLFELKEKLAFAAELAQRNQQRRH